jgi:sugar-specific transcriptional regulator TrmB
MLTQIGFTEYEAKVYLTLLHENPATGYHLSKKSGVPRSMVYETLGRLSARGAALESVEGRVTFYTPLPPDLLMDRYEDEQQRMTENLREGLQKLYEVTDEDKVWSITGLQPTLAYASRMIAEAQQEVHLVLADDDLEVLSEDIAAAHNKGVSISTLLTGKADLNFGRVAYHPPLESELQELTNTLVVVSDNHQALIASKSELGTTTTITGNHNLVLMARQFVWMELFAQRVLAKMGREFLDQLEPEDRKILISTEEAEDDG